MSMEVDFAEPYLETLAPQPSPLLTPQYMEVSIAGRPYVVDTSFEPYRRDAFRHRSIQAQREAIALDNLPGVGTVNTEGLWRREAWDWHFGAGQPYQDRKDSVDSRFSTSKGINPWMQWQVELHDDTKSVFSLAGNGQVVSVGKYTYVVDIASNTLSFSDDLVTWTPVTGITGTILNIATDGFNVWIGTGSELDTTTAGAASASTYVGAFPCAVWWVADRLMAAATNNVYNVVTNAAPPALFTHPNSNFRFFSMCAGSSQIYIGGYDPGAGSPTQSVVYRSTIDSNGVALTVPVQALPMEGGEYVTSLYGYLNFIFVGTNLGLRMCRTLSAFDPSGNQGDLEAGPLIPGLFPPGPVTHPVRATVGNNRFVYFGWSDYDNDSTGIGRCDLSAFIDTQSPAFASDLMVGGTGEVTSLDWCPLLDAPIFVVSGKGVYTSTKTPVDSGYVTSGYLSYGISDDKIALAGDIGTISPQQGTVTMSLASDAGSNIFAFVGEQVSASSGGTPNQSVFAIKAIRGEQFTLKLALIRDPLSGETPIMHRWMLKAIPAITAGTTVSVVLRLWNVEDIAGGDYYFDPYVEKAFLENLRTTQSVFAYVEGPLTYPYCTIDEIDWLPEKHQDALVGGGYEGNVIVYLKTYDLGA